MTNAETHLKHYSQNALAPYVQDRRLVSSVPVAMLEICHRAGEIQHPPICELLLVQQVSPFTAVCDFGAGSFNLRPNHSALGGAMAEMNVEVDRQHRIRTLAIPITQIENWEQQEGTRASAGDLGHLHSEGFESPLIDLLCKRLWREAETACRLGKLFADAALLTLWSELRLVGATDSGPKPRRRMLAAWQERRCVDFLNHHFAEDLSIDDLASLVGLSPFHFSRAFKASTGLPPFRYQVQLRIEKAKALLENSDLTVTTIAFMVGYQSSQALARVFRVSTGMSPRDYRRARTH